MLEKKWDEGKFVCVGLDTELEKIPEAARRDTIAGSIVNFNRIIIGATANLVCAFKPNSAFYEAEDVDGLKALVETTTYIRQHYPEVPIILDAKRADIGNTNRGYVVSAFGVIQADAITLHPYLGREALQPFLDDKDKGCIILCKTSNPGAGEFQDVNVETLGVGHLPLYKIVADQVARKWNTLGNCALVAGATYPEELGAIRKIVGDMPLLIPGIGAQQGDVEKTVKNGMDSRKKGMIINSSRGIIFASKGGPNIGPAAREETLRLSEEINKYRR
ncbi:MAG: orotidine-5'-phosphate decarboxylase [Candidatus Curtissbacteria bacterium]|nr:orotidine-5'-phosphate decarboxylase [Candidatus Curtissbacteria bacterium]